MHPQISSLLTLVVSVAGSVYLVAAFAHARLASVDLLELERLRTQGLFSSGSTLEQEFRVLTYLLSTLAPALEIRQEGWVRLYYHLLRMSATCLGASKALRREMRRLVAYQAGMYAAARGQLQQA
jgi:hypothetical protein